MGILDRFKSNKPARVPAELPPAMQPEDPVNYNSVLDYLVGLSDKDYKKMTGSAEIYRKANKDVAKLIGIKDEPTTAITTERPEITDDQLDDMPNTPPDELAAAFIDDEPAPKAKKKQSTEKKIEVKE